MYERKRCSDLEFQIVQLEKIVLEARRQFWKEYPDSKFRIMIEKNECLIKIKFPKGEEGMILFRIAQTQKMILEIRDQYELDCGKLPNE
jgi:hypothetical protein